MSNENDYIILPRVRLVYPQIFTEGEYTENGETKKTKRGSKLLLDPTDPVHAEKIQQVRDKVAELAKAKWGRVPPDDRLCIRDGESMMKEWADGMVVISANNNNRIWAVKRDKTPAQEEDQLFYSGSYANAKIGFWLQDNSYGKRVNANLELVQFVADGDPIAGGGLSLDDAVDGLDELPEDDLAFLDGEDAA